VGVSRLAIEHLCQELLSVVIVLAKNHKRGLLNKREKTLIFSGFSLIYHEFASVDTMAQRNCYVNSKESNGVFYLLIKSSPL